MKTIFNSTKSKAILLSVLFLIFLGFSFSSNVSQFSNSFNTFFGFQVAESYGGGGGDGGCCGGGGEGNDTPTPPTHEHEDQIPSCVISASPTSLIKGNTTTLKWSTTRTNTASINQGVGYVLTGTDKTMVVSPATNTTYTMTVTSVDNITRTCATTVTVTNPIPAPTCVLSATPTSITAGRSSRLTWTATNAVSGAINQGIGAVAPNNSAAFRNVTPSNTTTYTMTVKNSAGATATCARTVTVIPAPLAPTCDSFTVTPNTITRGSQAHLAWQTTRANTVVINNGIGSVAVDGSRLTSPLTTTTYTLTAIGANNLRVTCVATVTVIQPTPAPTCDSFTATPNTIDRGDSTILRWQSTNATTAVLKRYDGQLINVAVDGSLTASPVSNFTFILTLTGPGGSVTCNRPVTVIQPNLLPICDSFTASPSILPVGGGNTTLTWRTTNANGVRINPLLGAVAVDDSRAVLIATTTNFVLTATDGHGHSDSCTVRVLVTPVTPTPITCSENVSFSVNPSSITRGDNSTLTWSTTGITSLSFDNGISTTALGGTYSVSPSDSTTYTMTATDGSTTIHCPVNVTVNTTSGGGGGGSPTPRCTLSASDMSISAGDRVTLKWNTTNATGIILRDNFSKTLITTAGKSTNDKRELYDGEITVRPDRTTTYNLFASRGSKERKCEVTVGVKDNVVVLQTRDQLPLVSGITLTQVPYTGFEAGPFLTLSFYTLLGLWALYLAYVLVIRRNSLGGVSLATADFESTDEKMEQNISNLFVDTAMNKPIFHQPTTVTRTAPVAQIGYESMVVTSEETNEIENRAHIAHVLFSSDAMRYFVATTEDMDRIKVLDAVLERTKASYPAEDGWVVLNEDRIKTQCEACRSEEVAKSNESPFIPAALPIGNSSLAEVIVSGNIVAAYQMIGNRPMIALADAAADLDALYRIKQGGEATVSNMLASSGENVTAEQLHSAISAITSALDGTYSNEAEAVKMAIMKATKAING